MDHGESHNPEYANRIDKIKQLKNASINPYPNEADPSHSIHELVNKTHKALLSVDDAKQIFEPSVKICGRIVLFRDMGKTIFIHLQEEASRIQILLIKDHSKLINDQAEAVLHSFELIKKRLDIGDLVEVEGVMCRTIKGELSIFCHCMRLICKSLSPLPEKFHGLVEKETIYRKRYLDLLTNTASFETFRTRWSIIKSIREFCSSEGFEEVETPILQSIYGGANARPFTTHINAISQDMFLRISLEIPLKKLLIGGMLKVFEIGKVFRNEGIDIAHNPEFTMLEAYSAYWNYTDMMVFVETLVKSLCKTIGKHTFTIDDQTIDLTAPWKRMTMKESIDTYANLNVDRMSEAEMFDLIQSSEHTPKSTIRGLLIAQIFDIFVQPKLITPHHITCQPLETTPLCKLMEDKEGSDLVLERFESFIFGEEICNAYSELNDPILQKHFLMEQASSKVEDPHPIDNEFIEALEHGMPPAGGIGIGIDRLVMVLTEKKSIKDVILFPILRHQSD